MSDTSLVMEKEAGNVGATNEGTSGSTLNGVGSLGASGETTAIPSGNSATAGASATGSESLTVREALANYGLDLRNDFKDDHSALQYLVALVNQAQQAQQLSQYGQLYLQHADKFQQYLKQQNEQAAANTASQAKKWWEAPEYDPSWQSKIYRDQNGELKTIPGADPTIIQKYLRWVEHQRNFMDKLSMDPIGTIRPGIEELIDQRAAQIVEQRLRQTQEYGLANQILSGNASWMFERDADGRIQYHQDGRPKFSPAGQLYGQYVLHAQNQLGIYDVQRQHDYALAMTQRDVLLARLQQTENTNPSTTSGEELKANFLRQAAGNTSGSAAPPGNVQGSYQTAHEGTRGLADLMRQEFLAAGVRPDATISR